MTLGDLLTPVQWRGSELVAEPRSAPILISARRAAKAAVVGTPIRSDTDARTVEVARCTSARRVAAVVRLRRRKADSEGFRVLTGHERFEAATHLLAGGALRAGERDTDVTAPAGDAKVSEHLRLASLPYAGLELSRETVECEVAELVQWWGDVTKGGR